MTKTQICNHISIDKSIFMSYALKLTNHQEDAEELFQDTVLKLLLNRKKLDGDLDYFRAYCSRTMLNVCIDTFRRKSSRPNNFIRIDAVFDGNDYDGDKGYVVDSLFKKTYNYGDFSVDKSYIEQAIKNVPMIYRECLVWSMQGYKYRVISEGLNISIGTVKANIYRARRMLKEELITFIELN